MIFSGQNKLTGFINSILEYSKVTEQWEIRSGFNNTLMAFTNETTDFPEGMHPWYFDSNCKDESFSWRMLKIHRHVKLPGYFCCDDGHCIKSDLACDSIPHCRDNSDEDETKCSPGSVVEMEIEFFDTFITFHQTPSNFYRILELTYTQM